MNDRQLLENAAKAAGYKLNPIFDEKRKSLGIDSLVIDGISSAWNPLKDDSHAMRLAVSLGMFVMPPDDDDPCAVVRTNRSDAADGITRSDECGNKYAATRRAIVLAAANIGAAIPVNSPIKR